MSKKSDKVELGNKVREAMLKFGRVEGEGTVVCIPTHESRKLLGSNDEIENAMSAVGINDKLVRDVKNNGGKDMTCIATTITELMKKN